MFTIHLDVLHLLGSWVGSAIVLVFPCPEISASRYLMLKECRNNQQDRRVYIFTNNSYRIIVSGFFNIAVFTINYDVSVIGNPKSI